MPPFERHEYEDRLGKTRARMATAGIDVLLLSSPANMYYLTGYDGWSMYVHQMAIVGPDGPPIWAGRQLDANGALLTCYMEPGEVRGYPDDYVSSDDKHPMQFVADLLRERRWDKGVVGVEMDAYYYTARCHQALLAALPDARFKDAGLLVNRVRNVKSERELLYMRQAGRIAEHTMAATIEAIRPGVRQCEPMATLYHTQIMGADGHAGDYTCKPPNAPTGKWAKAAHLAWDDDIHRPGDTTFLELGACRHRYHAPLSRTVYLGKPPQAMRDTAETIVDGLNAALEAARPGVTCEEVEAAWRRVVAPRGIVKEQRIGYPVGIGFPPTWGELTLSLRPGDRTVLQKNMTLHCVPAIWRDDWSIVISESFIVGERGAESLANFPRRLFWKE